jgi:uncharacterized membrane protein YkvA (DUF1232 family)
MNDVLTPDEKNVASPDAKLSAKELALLLPNLIKLFWRLARDRRVRRRTRWLLFILGAYVACPIDLIPDWIPVLGYLDDVFVIGFLLHRILRSVPPEILAEHWQGTITLSELSQYFTRRKQKRSSSPSGEIES